jgi:hypothetical protein
VEGATAGGGSLTITKGVDAKLFYRLYLLSNNLNRDTAISRERGMGAATNWGSNKITSTKVGTIMTNYSKQHTNPVNNFREEDAVTLVNFMEHRDWGWFIA